MVKRAYESKILGCFCKYQIVLASSVGGPSSIPSLGPSHAKDVIKMVPVVPLFSTQH